MLAWLTVPFAALIAIGPVKEADLYWHIRMGADILANGRLGGDPAWTYGPAELGWRTTQAGAELLLYGLYEAFSWQGMLALRLVLAAALATSVLFACSAVVRTRPKLVMDRSVALVSILTVLAMIAYAQERPQTLSLLLLPWVGVLLLRVMYADHWPRWWVVGLVVMVWCWFHGAGALVGPVLVAASLIHALGAGGLKWLPILVRSVRKGWAVVAAALVAPMLGPLGIGFYTQASRIQDAATLRIQEWTPPGANSAVLWLALAMVGAWGIALIRLAAASGRVWRTFRMDMLLLVGLMVAMTSAGRYLGIGILLLGPLVARRLAQAWIRPSVAVERMRPRIAGSVVAIASVLVATASVLAVVNVRPVDTGSPLAVWRELAAEPEGRRAIVDYNLGGQAGLLGDVVVAIDGRVDRYGGDVVDAYLDLLAGRPGWQDTFDRYPGTTDVIAKTDSGLVDRMTAAGWTTACVDGDYTWLTAPGVTGQCADEAAD